MYSFFIILFVLTCVAMILMILLQAGKGKGLAGAFGGATSGAVFGGRGAATFLSRSTTILAVAYMVLCLLIGILYKSDDEGAGQSLMQQQAAEEVTFPATDIPVAPIPEQGQN
jgi:preprotein translocase subunit SecG